MRGRTLIDCLRTALAVCALYAFALQGFAGSVVQAEAGLGPLCSHDASDPSGPVHPAGGDARCCLVACLSAHAAAPASTVLTVPRRSVTSVAWRPDAHQPASLRATPAFRARGPPPA